MNLLPFTMRVNAVPPAMAKVGESEVAIGAGLSDASTVIGGLVARACVADEQAELVRAGGLWHRHRPRPIRDARAHVGPLEIARVGCVGARECQPVVAPPKPSVSVTVTALPGATADALTVSVAEGSIVNSRALDVPPPGPGVCTLTCAVPAADRSLAAIEASSLVVLISRVGRSAPFQRTTENVLNPLPITVSVSGPRLARPCVGSVALMAGAGFVTGRTMPAPSAA